MGLFIPIMPSVGGAATSAEIEIDTFGKLLAYAEQNASRIETIRDDSDLIESLIFHFSAGSITKTNTRNDDGLIIKETLTGDFPDFMTSDCPNVKNIIRDDTGLVIEETYTQE